MAKILVVDDENNIRLMVRLGLRADGHEVETAADGNEALEKFGDGARFDAVLLDQRMPGVSGLEVLREMRRREPSAKIIMITAFGTIDLAADALREGAADFLRKPFTMDVLRGALQAVLSDQPSAISDQQNPQKSSGARENAAFRLASINGFRIVPEANAAPAPDAAGALRCVFGVRGPDAKVQSVEVVLPAYFIEHVKAHADRETLPDAAYFWCWLGEESLANYLWQHAEAPPQNRLQVEELSTSLRRWIDVVLTH